jgi:hypothetical protein
LLTSWSSVTTSSIPATSAKPTPVVPYIPNNPFSHKLIAHGSAGEDGVFAQSINSEPTPLFSAL